MVTQANPTAITRTTTPVIGGILSIVAAGISLLLVVINSILSPSQWFLGLGGLWIAMLGAGILGLIGGILAIKRRQWILSLIGVAATIVSFAGVLGVIATVLVAISKKEFNNPSST
jgi:hypothetical protein